MSKVLVEHLNFSDANMVVEAAVGDNNEKNLYLKGVFIRSSIRNLNGRVYPQSEIKRAVEDINALLEKGESVLGECDHPEKLTINLDRVSHMITGMWMDGNAGCGKLKILPTPTGQIIRTLLESGVRLGVSSRGSGDVDEQGTVSNFEIITVDIVQKPSAAAYPSVVYESLESRRGRIIEDLATSVRDDPKAQKYLKEELLNWISGLK